MLCFFNWALFGLYIWALFGLYLGSIWALVRSATEHRVFWGLGVGSVDGLAGLAGQARALARCAGYQVCRVSAFRKRRGLPAGAGRGPSGSTSKIAVERDPVFAK